jgi:rRNA small subunit pseudouridine methyltransferase Nep1
VAECKAALVPQNREDKDTVIVVLEKAPLELIQMRDKRIELVNCDDHKKLLQTAGKEFSRFRPDIVHQCLLTLLDSPLNKAGKLIVYIHTEQNVLIEVSPMLRVPRTFKRFSGLMVELLQKHKIKAAGSQDYLLKVIANPIQKYLPAGAVKVGLSVGGRLISAPGVAKEYAEKKQVVFVIGAVSHDDPVKEPKYGADYVEELVSVSNFSLSAACCCGKLCEAYEQLWEIL